VLKQEFAFKVTPKGAAGARPLPVAALAPGLLIAGIEASAALLVGAPGQVLGAYALALLYSATYLAATAAVVALHWRENRAAGARAGASAGAAVGRAPAPVRVPVSCRAPASSRVRIPALARGRRGAPWLKPVLAPLLARVPTLVLVPAFGLLALYHGHSGAGRTHQGDQK